MSESKTHHFVSQGLLSSFKCDESTEDTSKIYFININGKIDPEFYPTNLINLAAKKYLYNYTNNEFESLEKKYFNTIDSDIANAILLCNEDEEINDINNIKIIKYVAAQITRTPDTLALISNLDSLFRSDIGGDFCLTKYSTIKNNFLKTIVSNTEKYIKILKNKRFKVYRNITSSFVISDNPVLLIAFSNEYEIQFPENSYITVIDYPIFIMPISPTKLVIYYDNNISDDELNYYIENHNRLQFINASRMVFSNKKSRLIDGIKTLYEDNFNYLERTKPGITKAHKLEFGDPISIGKPQISLTPEVAEKIKNLIMNSVI